MASCCRCQWSPGNCCEESSSCSSLPHAALPDGDFDCRDESRRIGNFGINLGLNLMLPNEILAMKAAERHSQILKPWSQAAVPTLTIGGGLQLLQVGARPERQL